MKLVLIRHAEAVALGDRGTRTDYDRMLTDAGKVQAHRLGEALKRLAVVPGMILTSPLVRAHETAQALAEIVTPDREPTACEWLALGERRPKRLSRTVAEFGNAVTYLVGHQPDLSAYAGWLLGCGPISIDFDKSAAALVKFPGAPEKGTGELKWLVPPAWLL
jgi:phosphohistidine phosphatase